MKQPWEVKIEDEATKVFETDVLTEDDKNVLRLWVITVSAGGPPSLTASPSIWNDHALTGKWAGHRASNFSHKGRVIYYYVVEPEKIVVVVRITVDHDYK